MAAVEYVPYYESTAAASNLVCKVLNLRLSRPKPVLLVRFSICAKVAQMEGQLKMLAALADGAVAVCPPTLGCEP